MKYLNKFSLTLVAAFIFGSMNINAQESDNESADDDVEEVIVTGSRIVRQDNVSSPTPMLSLGEDQIELTGSVNVYDILSELPQAGEGTSRGNTNFTVGSSGLQTVNLRGLGSGRTLTLVNGRRWVGGVPGTGIVDLNSIPTDLIERLEVITGGASAVYGSDAVAGVVNVILKDSFEGISIEAMKGGYDAGDGDTSMTSITFGGNFADGRGNAVVNFRVDEQGRVMARDRTPYTGRDLLYYGYYYGQAFDGAYSDYILDPAYSSYIPQGRFFVSGDTSKSQGMLTFDCSQRNEYAVLPSSTVVDYAAAGGGTACGFNRTYFRALEVPLDRYSAFSSVTYDLSDEHQLFAEISFNSVDSQSEFEPVPFNSEDVYGGLGTMGYNIMNPYMPAEIRDAAIAAQGGTPVYAADGTTIIDYVRPNGTMVQVPFIRRLLEFGNRGSGNTRETFRAAFGMEGTIGDYRYDWYYQYGVNDRVQTSGAYNAINMRYALNANLNDSGVPQCADAAAREQGCIPINFFGLGAATQEQVDYVFAETMRLSKNTQEVFGANLTGDFNILGKDISFATGFERRTETADDNPDDLQEAGLHGGNLTPRSKGEYDVDGYYLELLVPLVSDVTLVQDLTFEAAYRTDDYSTSGSVSASKFGLNWIINDEFRVRSVVAESVRAPDIDDLFSGQAQTFEPIDDPCSGLNVPNSGLSATVIANCSSIPDVLATSLAGSYDPDLGAVRPGFFYTQPDIQTISGFIGGNPDLKEESADTTTIGLVWTPPYVEGLAVSLDYYEIQIDDVISSVSAQRLINECFNSADFPNTFQCGAHERFPGTGKLRYWYSYGINQSKYETAGYDLAAAYTFENLYLIPGSLSLRGIYTKRDKHVYQTTATSAPFDSVGEVGYNEDTAKVTAVWNHNNWLLSIDTTYRGKAQDDMAYPSNEYHLMAVDARTYVDVQARYTFDNGLSVYLGVDNATDENPPFCPNCKNEPNPGSHYTGGIYRVWDSMYTYAGFRYDFKLTD
jgi:outer membrane receptor protein involved in Fe transport